ncbi:MAG: hypothetical protein NDI73_06545 [Desulfuromonadales bacterium]|nr:hypothetical protein [Desulfuromonadales bacterium]
MSNLLIRNLPEEVVIELKRRAQRHKRPLQQEVREILVRASGQPLVDVAEQAAAIRNRLAAKGKILSDSVDLLREDRSR